MNKPPLPQITISHVNAALSRLDWLDDRFRCRTDLHYLLTAYLGRNDMLHPWLAARCHEVQAEPDGCLDLWARDHRKSTIITFAKSIQDILRSHGDDALEERECTIGIFSHTRPIAKGFLRQIKRELETNSKLQDLFPDILYKNPQKDSPKWNEDDGIVVIRQTNPKESTVEAHGLVDGMPTGKHYTHRVYDDVVVPASVTTPEMMKKTVDAIQLSNNLGTSGGVKRFIGTRYHYNDAYKHLIDGGSVKTRVHPATEDGTPIGTPVLLSAEEIAEKRRDQGSYVFACQMLLNPKSGDTQGFQRSFLEDRHNGVNWSRMNTYLLIDPAGSKKKKGNDFTSAWAIGLADDKKIYILDMVRDKLNLIQRTRLLFEWHRKFKPKETRYEHYGMQADIEHIKYEQGNQNYRFEITEVGGQTPKNDRINRLLPYFEQKKFVFPRSVHYTQYDGTLVDLVNEFIEQEYTAFPVAVHDDMLDSLARLCEPDLTLIWPSASAAPRPPKQRLSRVMS